MIGLESFGAELWRLLEQLGKTANLRDTDVSGMLERLENTPETAEQVKKIGRQDEFSRQFLKMKDVHSEVNQFRISCNDIRVPHKLNEEQETLGTRRASSLQGDGDGLVVTHEISTKELASLKKYLQKIVFIDRNQADISSMKFTRGVNIRQLTECSEMLLDEKRRAGHFGRLHRNLHCEMKSFSLCSLLHESEQLVANDVSDLLKSTIKHRKDARRRITELRTNTDGLKETIALLNTQIDEHLKLQRKLTIEGLAM